jgi:hypothetical protein
MPFTREIWIILASALGYLSLIRYYIRKQTSASFGAVESASITILGIGVLGWWTLPVYIGGSTTYVISDVSTREAEVALIAYSTAGLSILAGATSARLLRVNQQVHSEESESGENFPFRLVMLLILVFVAAALAGYGLDNLWSREYYIVDAEIKVLRAATGPLTIPVVCLCGYAFGAGRRSRRSGAGWLCVAIIVGTYTFASGSRSLVLIMPAFWFGSIMATRRIRPAATALCLLSLPVLYPLPFATRAAEEHGLRPYTQYITDGTIGLIGGVSTEDTLSSLFVSFPLTGYVAERLADGASERLVAASNPLPGSLAGWSRYEQRSQVANFEGAATLPQNFLGMAAAAGPGWVVLLMTLAGVILELFDRTISDRFRTHGLSLVGLLFGSLFGLMACQYGPRLFFRYLQLALGLVIVALIIGKTGRSRKTLRPEGRGTIVV